MNILKAYEQTHNNSQLERGQGLVEYGLIIAFVAVTAILVLANVGTSVSESFDMVNCTLTDPTTGACVDAEPTEEPDPDPCPNLQVLAAQASCRASNDRFHVRVDFDQCPTAMVAISSPIQLSMSQNPNKPERFRRGINSNHPSNIICDSGTSLYTDATVTIYHDGTESSTHTTTVTTPIIIK